MEILGDPIGILIGFSLLVIQCSDTLNTTTGRTTKTITTPEPTTIGTDVKTTKVTATPGPFIAETTTKTTTTGEPITIEDTTTTVQLVPMKQPRSEVSTTEPTHSVGTYVLAFVVIFVVVLIIFVLSDFCHGMGPQWKFIDIMNRQKFTGGDVSQFVSTKICRKNNN